MRDMQQLLLQVWGNSKKTVVFVTHNVREAVRLGDRPTRTYYLILLVVAYRRHAAQTPAIAPAGADSGGRGR